MEEILKLMDELKETTTDKSKLSEMETQNQELAKQIKTLEDRKSYWTKGKLTYINYFL